MRISCFTFIRNGTRLAYPFVQSIRSALPLCDEFVVVAGDSVDDTRAQIAAIGDPKIRIVDTVWNPLMLTRGYIYAQQKMIGLFNCTGDWAFYLEGDELLHEDDIPKIRASMERHLGYPEVEALYFDYIHFYGNPDWVNVSHTAYREEVRVVRNTLRIFTTGGLYFLVIDDKNSGRYPRAASADARIFHYGYVRSGAALTRKDQDVLKFWGKKAEGEATYAKDARLLAPFTGTHPVVMKEWLATEANHDFTPERDPRPSRRTRKELLTRRIESILPVDFSKRHFKRVKT
jgi:glycosyltransferase involved in cell wall biosynthesis